MDKAAELQEKKAAAKETHAGHKAEHQKALADWKVRDDERKVQNEAKREAWKQAVVEWKAQRDLAKEWHEKWTGGKQPVLGGV